jgi:hypothetical protein
MIYRRKSRLNYMEDIQAELNHLINAVLRKEDVKRLMDKIREEYAKIKEGK